MPSDRTFVTEIATGLGMMGSADLAIVIASRPPVLANLASADWERLSRLYCAGTYRSDFEQAFSNGQAFLGAGDALRNRQPRLIEWTGGRRPPGDEALPADLRVDHVYLVSCKYLSKILHNPSPARLFEGLLATGATDDRADWYARVAPDEYQRLYESCSQLVEGQLPWFAGHLTPMQRRHLAKVLRTGWPESAAKRYAELCDIVAERSAEIWRDRLDRRSAELFLWRLLRINSTPYFVLGSHAGGSMRLRIDTPWDWRQAYRLVDFSIEAQSGGQARVGWAATCELRTSGEQRVVTGHVEVRWSHGRFGQPPEAKVYLDSPPESVPGYHLL